MFIINAKSKQSYLKWNWYYLHVGNALYMFYIFDINSIIQVALEIKMQCFRLLQMFYLDSV